MEELDNKAGEGDASASASTSSTSPSPDPAANAPSSSTTPAIIPPPPSGPAPTTPLPPPPGPGSGGPGGPSGPGNKPQQPLSVMLTALQTLVGRLSPIVLPGLHWATYVSTWQDRTTSLAVCLAWCFLCLAPRFCLVYGPHALILMYMGFHYSEKIKSKFRAPSSPPLSSLFLLWVLKSLPVIDLSLFVFPSRPDPKGKPTQPKVPPLPRMVRYITRILAHVHAILDKMDRFVARLSWKVPNEQESIHLFQAILLSYGIWIFLNAILPLGVIIMLTGLVVIAWHSEAGEIVREIVSTEWDKARGRTPVSKDIPSSVSVSGSGGSAEAGDAKKVESSATVGTVNFGNFEATVSLNPYTKEVVAPEVLALKKAEKEAKAATAAALKAQLQADRAEEIARAAIVASELASNMVMEDTTAVAIETENQHVESVDVTHATHTDDAPEAPSNPEESKESAETAEILKSSPATKSKEPAETSSESKSGEEQTGDQSTAQPVSPQKSSPQIVVETITVKDDLVDRPSSPTKSIADDNASITSSNAASNLSASEASTAALAASNRLQQKLADLAKKRLREAAAAKSAAAAAAQRAAERLAAVKAATPEPRRAREALGADDEDDDDDDSDMGANSLNLNSVGSNRSGSESEAYLSMAAEPVPKPLSAVLLAAAGAAADRTPARTSSRVHSALLQQQQRALSPEYQQVPSPVADPTTVSGLRQRRKAEEASADASSSSGARVATVGYRAAPQAEYRRYGSLRLSDDEDEDTNTVILHDDGLSMVSGYSTRSESLPRSVAGSSVSTGWNNRNSIPSHYIPPQALDLSSGLSSLGQMIDGIGKTTTPTPGSNLRRSSILTTGTDEDMDSDDEHSGSVLAQRMKERRRSLESDMFTLDRHEGTSKEETRSPTDYRNAGPNSRIPGVMQLPRPLQMPPVYNDPFATRAEQMKAQQMYPTSSHSTSSSSSATSYFAAPVYGNSNPPLSPGSGVGSRGGSSIMTRSSSRWENKKPLDVVLSFECFENQRWWVGVGWVPHLLPAERPPWTDFTGTRATPKESFELLPFRKEQLLSWKTEVPLDLSRRYAWEWDGAWYVDTKGGNQIGEVDEEGWAYADNFWKDWKNRKTLKRVVRHRRWVRHARLFELGNKQNVKFSSDSLDDENSFEDANDEYNL
ncbi:peroxisome- protein [Phlyctochytrium planicorne]|nr:peroxisome- protein [Phlyctochytrium planicorne]